MPTHKISEKRDFGPVLFFYPLSEIKNGLQDYYAQTKTKTRNEKNFFPKYTPLVLVESDYPHKVYCPHLSGDNK